MKFPILFITTSDLSGKSGHNIATKEIVEAFVRNEEIDTILLCPKPKFSFPKIVEEKALRIIFFKPILNIFPLSIVFIQLLIWIKANKILKEYDKITVVSRLGNFFVSNYLLVRKFQVPYILLIRGLSNFRNMYQLKFYNRLNQRISIWNIESSTKVYVAYKEIKDLCSKYIDEKKVEIFNNAVDPLKFKSISKKEARNHIGLNLNEEDFLVGFVGSIQDRHHILELIQALEEILKDDLASRNKSIKVLIVGEGVNSASLKKYVFDSNLLDFDNVVFTGFINHEKVSNYISACDVMYGVVSPLTMSNPIKCFEYLAAGRPIISSKIRDLEFVSINKIGFLLEDLNPSSIKKAIFHFHCMSEEELDSMGTRGNRYVLKNHSWNHLPTLFLKNLKEEN